METLNIKIAEYFNGQVNGRSSIDSVLTKEIKEQNLILDFQNITFISRSVADELLLLKEEFSKNGENLSFMNFCAEAKGMIDKVIESRSNNKTPISVNRLTFSNKIEFDKYLLSF